MENGFRVHQHRFVYEYFKESCKLWISTLHQGINRKQYLSEKFKLSVNFTRAQMKALDVCDDELKIYFPSKRSDDFCIRYHLRIFQQLPHQTIAYLNGK